MSEREPFPGPQCHSCGGARRYCGCGRTRQCAAWMRREDSDRRWSCQKASGHDGAHVTENGEEWTDEKMRENLRRSAEPAQKVS